MATRSAARTTTAKRKKATSAVLLRYRNRDTAFGVSRNTAIRLAKTLGLSETQANPTSASVSAVSRGFR